MARLLLVQHTTPLAYQTGGGWSGNDDAMVCASSPLMTSYDNGAPLERKI
jgi:hypothetical protein